MAAKFLASLFSFLSIFLAIYAQSLVRSIANDADDSTEFEFETAIYYGDSNVNLGEPFSITCIIPITDPIYWLKDGEPITRHNLRHGHDEHSFMLAESAIEGEKHKIEAHISVRHALKVHEGKYQCNSLHTSYHMLHVRSPSTDANDNQLSTETVYETIQELLTPSTVEAENIFTRTWEPIKSNLPTLPPDSRTTQKQQQLLQQQQHRKHHHHHHQFGQQQQQLKPYQELEQQPHKFIYINATHFDGIPRGVLSESNENASGLVNVVEYLPPTQYNELLLTTEPWRSTASSIGGSARATTGTGRKQPPIFPPPRTMVLSTPSASSTTFSSSQTPVPPHFAYTYPGLSGDYYQSASANNAAAEQQQNARFPLQKIQSNYQQPPPKLNTYHQLPQPTRQTIQSMYTPHQQNQLQQPQHGHTLPFAPVTMTTGSISSLPPMHPFPQVVIMPKAKEPDFLVPNYDIAEQQLKVYEIRSALVLSCNITKDGEYDLTWEKNGTDVTKVRELEGRFRILSAERKFIIDKTDLYDDGRYSCVANGQKKHINVVARVVVRVPSNTGVVEGEKLTIVCTVVGTDPQLSWSIVGNLTISNSTGRFILKPDENHVENAILTVENISLDDRGEYKCIGRNAANELAKYSEASDVSYVRVKGKLAALWPFLGIVSEVLILCTIILIYEKRRNKSELDESDTDPQEQKKKRRSYD